MTLAQTAAHSGYTLVEMLVAMAVTSIVLTGTYAAYSFFSQQQQVLAAQTDVDRSALLAIDLMQSDIRMAGFKDVADINTMPASQAIVITQSNPGDISFVYDDYKSGGALYRTFIRYYVATYTPATGTPRLRLYRESRQCNDPSVFCTHSNSTAFTGESDSGEPILDWVTQFSVTGLNPKASGSFATQFQTVQVVLLVTSPKKIEGTSRVVSKNFTFIGRAKNVSLVP